MRSMSKLFANSPNYKSLVRSELTRSPKLDDLTYQQFYQKYQTLLRLAKKYKSSQPIKENIRFYDNFSPLIIAADRNLEVLAFRLLEQDDVNVNFKGERGLTALHCALTKGNLPLVRALVSKGANCADKNDYNHNGLHFAAISRNQEMVTFVLAHVDKSALLEQGHYHNLPLHLACISGCSGSIELIAKKMELKDIVSTGVNRNTPIYLAAESGSLDGVKVLLNLTRAEQSTMQALKCEISSSSSLLYAAVKSGNVKLYQFLKEQGALYRNSYRDFSHSLIQQAIKSKNADMVKQVIIDDKEEAGYLRSTTNHEQPILHYAIDWGNLDVVKILVESGVDINALSISAPAETVVEHARSMGRDDIASYLSANKDHDAKNDSNHDETEKEIKSDECFPVDPDKNYNEMASVCCVM